jgi:hypothetical protein
MELERNGFAVPLREPAFLAPGILVSGGNQASLELAALVGRVARQYLLERTSWHHGRTRTLAPALS